MTTTISTPAKVFTSEERNDGVRVRAIFLKIFERWTAADFARMIQTGNGVDPAFLWKEMFSNPITRIAGNLILNRVSKDPVHILSSVTYEALMGQIREQRKDIVAILQTPGGHRLLEFYLNGFKQQMCPHTNFVVRQGNLFRCTLCGKEEVKK
jgi:hypothetical protein